MKNPSARLVFPVWLCLAGFVVAQEKSPSGVQGIQGVKQEAVANVKNVETGTATGTRSDAQGVNKVNGVETINGVKADGRAVVPPANQKPPPPPPPPANTKPPPPPPPPPPPAIAPAAGTTTPAGGGSVGSAAQIRAIQGVSGINTAKLQNLEKALILKQAGNTPAGDGAEKGGKGKSAAAALLASPLDKKAGKKEDGRAGFQEFEKLQNNGS